ncbi:hypothetical protein [Granulibacter bethesdensis]|uniref:Uncharacterized protein n=1 Tax=Granulibacter bethesdensis (strain ATCC BAA-1260 / CGDNIH1) TaxID=391165 RepID=Q0BRZ4_GRABC|nr:hypothetical protein [Granulibacter bethesdensis]ABI62408.1 Hypothetical protein GbCGDNIH1_1510 [Granulibacter bethesdensis CGDNIH1]APG30679.1 Hypothetical protein GbCGDNIH2_1510 [Granulibacter bethesdensis]APH52242.1 Hypothetical protein GbCGDNIH5_1510 [Granulibacter bethesdensis]APH64935.1 Hypothetical protein GbCGDNIH1I4_1510 [Granulibacter bethesdensis]
MLVFQNIIARLHVRFLPEDVARFTVRTTPRIARFVTPIIEKLIRDDRTGETYRFAVALWQRWDVPPLNVYLGSSSLCRIDGPSTLDESGYRPAGGLVETPGLTAHLSPDEAHDLDNRIKTAIETTIRNWADETNRGHWKTLPQHQYRGAEDA